MNDQSPDRLLDTIARKRHISSGQCVFEVGQQALAIFRVVSGQVQLYRNDPNGQRILLHSAFSGDFFAEASLTSEHYHCSAMCTRDSEIEVFNSRSIKILLKQNLPFQQFWLAHLSNELRRQRAHVERLSLNAAADRVIHYLMTQGDPPGELTLNGSVSEWAEMLGLSREALYRTLSKMKKTNRLQQQGANLKLIFADQQDQVNRAKRSIR